jgi:hypothetical protein
MRDSLAHRRASGCVLPPRILPRSRPIAEGFSCRAGGCQCGSPSGRGPRVRTGRDIDNPWHGTQSSFGPGAGISNLPAQQSSFIRCLFWNGRYNWYQTGEEFNMAKAKSASRSPKLDDKPKTIQRTYRFDTKLFEAFEDDCATHLANPKRVIEAVILYWLDAGRDERAAMAHKHRERIGSGSRDQN